MKTDEIQSHQKNVMDSCQGMEWLFGVERSFYRHCPEVLSSWSSQPSPSRCVI